MKNKNTWRRLGLLTVSLILKSAVAWVHPPCASMSLSSRSSSSQLFSTSVGMPYPRVGVSVAVRCHIKEESYYLLICRGQEPNKGMWTFPGGKLELGETALEGGQRELHEEVRFEGDAAINWFPETISTADSIICNEDGDPCIHYLVVICFAELQADQLPDVKGDSDAALARWWRTQDLIQSDGKPMTPGLINHIRRTEFLLSCGALPTANNNNKPAAIDVYD